MIIINNIDRWWDRSTVKHSSTITSTLTTGFKQFKIPCTSSSWELTPSARDYFSIKIQENSSKSINCNFSIRRISPHTQKISRHAKKRQARKGYKSLRIHRINPIVPVLTYTKWNTSQIHQSINYAPLSIMAFSIWARSSCD